MPVRQSKRQAGRAATLPKKPRIAQDLRKSKPLRSARLYVPAKFREDRLPVLHDAIRRAGLAILVTHGADGLEATHVPMLLDADDGVAGTLRGLVALANPQWRNWVAGGTALAIFPGPDAYVSPGWYATKRETGKVVPTWNYITVHAYGELEFFDDPARLLPLVTGLTDRHEADRPAPWAVSDAPAAYLDAMLRGIVGFRLGITRLEGQWKLGQNRTAADRAGTIAGLRAEGRERAEMTAQAMADAVEPGTPAP
jgi:transcriptional regulator